MKTSLKICVCVIAVMVVSGLQGFVVVGPMSPSTCQPYPAADLMKWAQEAGQNASHQRSARVATYNGRVDCSSEEVASSRKGNPTRPPEPVQYYQYGPAYNPYSYW